MKPQKYRKKPVVIEALQWTGSNLAEITQFVGDALRIDSGEVYILTLEGEHHASIEDYIIKGVKGEFYPCKPDIFKQTYEVAEE